MTPTQSPFPSPQSPSLGDVVLLERLGVARADLLVQVSRRIVGQKDIGDGILTAVFAGGHALLVGGPGLAKTLIAQTTVHALDLKFSRIHFTPDLMPAEKEASVEATTADVSAEVTPVLTAEDVLALQHLVRRMPVAKALVGAAVGLVRRTRPAGPAAPAFIKEYISWGAGPRASQYLVLGAKARAALDGRPLADYDDLRVVAPLVLTHRLVINFAAEAAGRAAADIVEELVRATRWDS